MFNTSLYPNPYNTLAPQKFPFSKFFSYFDSLFESPPSFELYKSTSVTSCYACNPTFWFKLLSPADEYPIYNNYQSSCSSLYYENMLYLQQLLRGVSRRSSELLVDTFLLLDQSEEAVNCFEHRPIPKLWVDFEAENGGDFITYTVTGCLTGNTM